MDAPRTTKDQAKRLRRELSLPEGLLWKAIKGRRLQGLHFRKQHPVGPYVLDFYCESCRLAVEVDGGSHSFGDRPARDERRDTWLLAQGIETLRISAALVLGDVDEAAGTILAWAEARRGSPSSRRGLQPPPSRAPGAIHLPLRGRN